MKRGLKGFFKRGQKGFTLVELMVVMAIMAILSAVVIPAVSGTSEVSKNSQVTNDAGLINTADSDFYGDQTGVEVITTETVNIINTGSGNRTTETKVLPGIAVIDGFAAQRISTRWPEVMLTDVYGTEFPADNVTGFVKKVIINVVTRDTDGSPIYGILTEEALAEAYNAINWVDLTPTYTVTPNSVTSTSSGYKNYLWLVEKTTTGNSGVTDNSRSVAVFKLMSVATDEADDKDTLVYEKIY